MLGFVVAAAAFHAVRALPQSGPSPVLTARQEVVTSADGVTKTVQTKTGPKTAVTIGATAGVIVGFIALIAVGIWFGSWRRKKNEEWRRSMAEAETKNLNRHTMMRAQRPGSVPMTPTSSIGSTSKMGRKSSALSLTPSTTSSFASSGVNSVAPHEQRRPNVLHQPTPRTPSSLVQNSLLHQQHSEYPPPPPSNDRPDALSSTPPDMSRTSFYAQQPSRPSPLHNSVTLPPSEVPRPPQPQFQPSFEPPSRHSGAERDAAAPPSSRGPPSFQPPSSRKSRDMNLTIVIPPPHHQVPRVPPGLENGGDASANSMRSAEMGRAL